VHLGCRLHTSVLLCSRVCSSAGWESLYGGSHSLYHPERKLPKHSRIKLLTMMRSKFIFVGYTSVVRRHGTLLHESSLREVYLSIRLALDTKDDGDDTMAYHDEMNTRPSPTSPKHLQDSRVVQVEGYQSSLSSALRQTSTLQHPGNRVCR
jgi:hypothetical protein